MYATTTITEIDRPTTIALRTVDTGALVYDDGIAVWPGTVGEARDAVGAAITAMRSGVARKFTAAESHTLRTLEALEGRLAQSAIWGTIPGGWITVQSIDAAELAA